MPSANLAAAKNSTWRLRSTSSNCVDRRLRPTKDTLASLNSQQARHHPLLVRWLGKHAVLPRCKSPPPGFHTRQLTNKPSWRTSICLTAVGIDTTVPVFDFLLALLCETLCHTPASCSFCRRSLAVRANYFRVVIGSG